MIFAVNLQLDDRTWRRRYVGRRTLRQVSDELMKGQWCRYFDWLWLVATDESAVDVAARLIPFLHGNDRVVVLPVDGQVAGTAPREMWEWIRAHQEIPA